MAHQPVVALPPFEREEGVPLPYGACEHLRFNVSALNGNEEMYNPIAASFDIYTSFRSYFKCWRQLNQTEAQNPIAILMAVGRITPYDVLAVVLMTIAWTLGRYSLVNFVFKPFCRVWRMHPSNADKFPESAFKTLAYFVLWSSAMYVTFFREHSFFNATLSLWSSSRYRFSEQPLDLRLVYGLETSFYLHSCYTCLYVDKWKRDSPVMLLHHLVTLTLVVFSYSVSYLKIGILIFVLNDCSDVMLEAAKCFVYLKVKGARYEQFWNTMGTVCSSTFAVTWFFLRNILHLTKVWRSSSFGSLHSMVYLPPPMWFFFNVLVGSLYLFYIYWLYFIVIFIVRVWSGAMKEPDDIRDEEVELEFQQRQQQRQTTKDSDADSDSDSDLDMMLDSPGSIKGRKAD